MGLRIYAAPCRLGRWCFVFSGIGAKREISMAENPQVKGGVVPYLMVDGAVKAAEFYKKAFAAEIAVIHPPDEKGRTMHAHVYINGSSLMMSDAYPEHGHPLKEPAAFNMMLPVRTSMPGTIAPSRPAAPRSCRPPTCSGATATASSRTRSASSGRSMGRSRSNPATLRSRRTFRGDRPALRRNNSAGAQGSPCVGREHRRLFSDELAIRPAPGPRARSGRRLRRRG